ncbi:hypothetical protein [Streptomyces sp. NPDC050121]|uniref:hypothetical protein n=1 Tax=Streptomyces sp. NPDC050121 TaxID=3365601 RepID=UPI0037968004
MPGRSRFDISLSEDGDTEFGDLIMDSDSPSPWETVAFGLLQHTLRSILAELTPREAGIVSLRYGLFGGRPRPNNRLAYVMCPTTPTTAPRRATIGPCHNEMI